MKKTASFLVLCAIMGVAAQGYLWSHNSSWAEQKDNMALSISNYTASKRDAVIDSVKTGVRQAYDSLPFVGSSKNANNSANKVTAQNNTVGQKPEVVIATQEEIDAKKLKSDDKTIVISADQVIQALKNPSTTQYRTSGSNNAGSAPVPPVLIVATEEEIKKNNIANAISSESVVRAMQRENIVEAQNTVKPILRVGSP